MFIILSLPHSSLFLELISIYSNQSVKLWYFIQHKQANDNKPVEAQSLAKFAIIATLSVNIVLFQLRALMALFTYRFMFVSLSTDDIESIVFFLRLEKSFHGQATTKIKIKLK